MAPPTGYLRFARALTDLECELIKHEVDAGVSFEEVAKRFDGEFMEFGVIAAPFKFFSNVGTLVRDSQPMRIITETLEMNIRREERIVGSDGEVKPS